jgi:hypothetical protein
MMVKKVPSSTVRMKRVGTIDQVSPHAAGLNPLVLRTPWYIHTIKNWVRYHQSVSVLTCITANRRCSLSCLVSNSILSVPPSVRQTSYDTIHILYLQGSTEVWDTIITIITTITTTTTTIRHYQPTSYDCSSPVFAGAARRWRQLESKINYHRNQFVEKD